MSGSQNQFGAFGLRGFLLARTVYRLVRGISLQPGLLNMRRTALRLTGLFSSLET